MKIIKVLFIVVLFLIMVFSWEQNAPINTPICPSPVCNGGA